MASDFASLVLLDTPNASSASVSFMCGFWLGSWRKLTRPTVRTIPAAQVLGAPLVRGDGRLRESFSASFRHRTAYSSLRRSRQNPSVIPTIPLRAFWTASLNGLGWSFFAGLLSSMLGG